MINYSEAADERDEHLMRKIAMHLQEVCQAFHEWAQEEVKDAITGLQIQLQLEPAEPLRTSLSDALKRAQELNNSELERLRKQSKERMASVIEGGYQSFRDARESMEEVVTKYDAICQELLRIRSVVIALAIPTEPEA